MKPLIDALFIEVNPVPVKTAMNLLGFNVGDLRLPLAEMEEKNLEVLKQELDKLGIKITGGNMLRVIISGYSGKMGKVLTKCINEDSELEIVCGCI